MDFETEFRVNGVAGIVHRDRLCDADRSSLFIRDIWRNLRSDSIAFVRGAVLRLEAT